MRQGITYCGHAVWAANIAALEKKQAKIEAKLEKLRAKQAIDNRPSKEEIIARLRKLTGGQQLMMFEILTAHLSSEERFEIMYSV
jgi:hypothetical protein